MPEKSVGQVRQEAWGRRRGGGKQAGVGDEDEHGRYEVDEGESEWRQKVDARATVRSSTSDRMAESFV